MKSQLFKIFIFISALTFSTNAWGNTWTGKVGVGSGKGTATVTVYKYPFGVKTNSGSASSSNSTLQTATTDGWSTTDGSIEFTSSAETGYTFYAWYSNAACTKDENKSATYTNGKNRGETTTRYAKFNPNSYVVSFDGNGGSTPENKSVTYDAMYGTLPSCTRTGYTFAGWWTSATGGTQVTASTTVKITSAQTLYAHWTPKTYTVTLNPNGGTPTANQSVTATYDADMPTGGIAARTKTGYSFTGYYDAKSGGTQYYTNTLTSARTWNKASNSTLYAQWSANTYTVKFNGNGGSSPADKTVTYDAAYGELPTPTRTGYTFAGWWTDASAGTQVTSSTTVKITSTQTLYAHWTVNNYTITLNNQSATTAGTPSIAVTFDANTNLTSAITNPTRTNFTFEGYYTAVNGGGAQIINKEGNVIASVSGYTDASKNWKYANDLELFAYWKQNQTIQWTLPDDAGVEYTTGQEMGAVAYGDFSGAPSGLAITYTTNNASIATIVDGKLNVVTPNAEVTVYANQSGNHDYNAALEVSKTFTTAGCTPDGHSVTADPIDYGQTLASSTLSGTVTAGGVAVAGTLSWVEPTTAPNAGANQPFAVLFTPTNTAVYGAYTFNVKVTVDKADPVITWNITSPLYEEVRYDHFVESSNKETGFSISVSNTTLLGASGTTLTTGSVDNKASGTIRVQQAASANYNAVDVTKSVDVYPKAGICLPIDLRSSNGAAEDDYNKAKVAQDGNVAWCGTSEDGHNNNYIAWFDVTYSQRHGIALGSWENGLTGLGFMSIVDLIKNGGFDYSSKSVDLFFSGIPDKMSLDVESQVVTSSPPDVSWKATQRHWYVYVSTDGKSFGDPVMAWDDNRDNVTYTFANENVRYVRIEYRGNFAGFVKNLRITQKKYLREKNNKTSLTFGTETNPLQQPQTLTLSYASLGDCGGTADNITVTSNNPAFYVDEPVITTGVGIEQKGEYVVRVRCNDVNQTGVLTFRSNDGTELKINVNSTKPYITTAATSIFETGTEHAPVSGTSYRALRAHDFSACFDGAQAKFDTLYIYGVSESSADDRQWNYDASKGYKVPAVSASNVHTPCFVYYKNGTQYTYARTFDASTKTLNIADAKTRVFVGYRAEAPTSPAIQISGTNAALYLNNTEIVAGGASLAANATSAVHANGTNILSSAGNAAVQLAGATNLSIEDTWKAGASSAILALRPATNYPSIDLGSGAGKVTVNGTQLELHNASHMAIAHMDGTTERYDGEVQINDGSIGGEATLGMPKRTFIDGGTFNDGIVEAYTVKGMPKRPRNSRGEMVSRHTMTKTALEAYDWYGQVHLTLDGAAKVNPMLMDETVWIFNGDDGEDYSDEKSWNKDGLPTKDDDVLINAPMVIAGGEMKVKSLTINWEDKGRGVPAVTVNPDGGLTVGQGGIDALKVESPVDNLALKAGQEGDVRGQTGFLRIDPNAAEPMPSATIELYSTAYYDMNATDHNETGAWQFVGYPLTDGAIAKAVFSKSFLYDWNVSTGEWENNRKTCVLQPFEGYATSQYRKADGWLTTFAGQMVQNVDKVINLTYNEGSEFTHNMVANSYSAPIDITKFEDSDFEGIQAAVYMFNTGSRADIKKLGETKSGSSNTPGQYLSIPIGSAAAMKGAFETPTVIAPMQGFCVHATEAGAKLRLDYEKLVYNATNKNTPLHVVAREQEQVGSLCVSIYAEGVADNLYLLESDQYVAAYENGYDAKKMESGEANIFAIEGTDHLAVDATNSIVGTRIGVRTGDTTAYVMTFTHLNGQYLALLDSETNEITEINEGTQYTFFAVPNSMITERFQIVASANAPSVTTGVDQTNDGAKAQKFIRNGQLYILKNGVLYNATGAIVR